MNIFVIILNDFFFNWGFEFGSGLMAKNVPKDKTFIYWQICVLFIRLSTGVSSKDSVRSLPLRSTDSLNLYCWFQPYPTHQAEIDLISLSLIVLENNNNASPRNRVLFTQIKFYGNTVRRAHGAPHFEFMPCAELCAVIVLAFNDLEIKNYEILFSYNMIYLTEWFLKILKLSFQHRRQF